MYTFTTVFIIFALVGHSPEVDNVNDLILPEVFQLLPSYTRVLSLLVINFSNLWKEQCQEGFELLLQELGKFEIWTDKILLNARRVCEDSMESRMSTRTLSLSEGPKDYERQSVSARRLRYYKNAKKRHNKQRFMLQGALHFQRYRRRRIFTRPL